MGEWSIHNFTSSKRQINSKSGFLSIYKAKLNEAKTLFLGARFCDDESTVSQSEAIFDIDNFLHDHFRDRDIKIAKALKSLYEAKGFSFINESAAEFKYFEPFENIFEYLVKEVLLRQECAVDIMKTDSGEIRKVAMGRYEGSRAERSWNIDAFISLEGKGHKCKYNLLMGPLPPSYLWSLWSEFPYTRLHFAKTSLFM